MKILGVDQATINSAYSLWVDGKLATYGKVKADSKIKDYHRSLQMTNLLMEVVNKYEPDVVILESCQMQNGNAKVFALLSTLRGMMMERLDINDYKFEIVPPVTWKSYIGIAKGKRDWQKAECISFFETKYDLDLNEDDDIADAMGIGYWGVSKFEKGK